MVHFMGLVEEVQGLWVAGGGHMIVYEPGTSSPLQITRGSSMQLGLEPQRS